LVYRDCNNSLQKTDISMSAEQTIFVKLFGVSPRDERMIQIVLSRQPAKQYNFALAGAEQTPDVALLNTEAAEGEGLLQAAKQANPALVTIYLSTDGQAGEGTYRIANRSLLFQLVLTLEDIAATQGGSTRRTAIDFGQEKPTAKPAAPAPAARSTLSLEPLPETNATPAQFAAPTPTNITAPTAPAEVVKVAPPPAPQTTPPPLPPSRPTPPPASTAPANSPSQYPQLAASKAPSPNDLPSERAFQVGVETMGMFNMRRLSALVVDDSVTVRNQLQAALQKAGLTADLASSGDQAMLMLSKQTYDIIFLDVVMPGDDGYAVCKAIRKLPANRQTQVMMLTSRSSPFDRARGALAGCDMYLIKPIDLKSFYAAVDRTIMKLCKNDRSVAASRGYQLSV
jgi:CheY-like chemotaxis protein